MNKFPTSTALKPAEMQRICRLCAAGLVAAMAPICALQNIWRTISWSRAARTVAPPLLILFFCAGCNPNIDVDGALLPAWLVAMILGVILAVGARALLIRTGIDRFLVARSLVYVSLSITFSCLVWLIVFRY
ncbi:MAG: DUF1656 domain-containing protein [Phycisphaerales bacterium]|nr:DUF1656 domain-containing protein [Phycisphaerales bacterium]